ncbi:C-terminal binding protein [Georgenia sp. AZ-5]|uniref:C-terminal binding protein n=1 Tax=Georgenia sp. AZ-5 TaxID=3367526 RepID=UPI0037549A36
MKIVITDLDHASADVEREVAATAGAELVLTQGTDPAEVVANAAGADGLLVQYAAITAEVLDALPSVRAVGRYGVGVETVDVDAATARGVAVCNVPDYGTEAVSDHAVALALTVGRGIGTLDRNLRAGVTDLTPALPVHQFAGRIFGVLGYGAIGRATARKAAGVGFEVIVTDATLAPGTATPEGYEVVGQGELLRRAQVLSVHVPLVPSTRHLLDAAALATMRPDAIVVNTSRGGVVDTDALVAALAEGRILGAGLDVFETEPLPADHPLTRFDRVVLTPHAAFYSEESYAELKRRTIGNVVDVLAGRTPRNIVNPGVLRGG